MRVMKKTRTIDMTNGNIYHVLISFAIPVLIGNLFQQLYNMVDTAVVGKYVNANALAGIGTTTPVITLILGVIIGMSNGMSVVIAQSFGKGEKEKTEKAITNGLFLMFAISIVVIGCGLLFSKPLFRIMNVPDEILGDALIYVNILFLGTLPKAAYNYESGILRAFGNSVIPLIFLIFTSIMNVVLDLLLVCVFLMGVMGVAVATVISEICSAILCFVFIKKKMPEINITKGAWVVDKEIILKHIKTGVPSALSQSCLGISFFVAQTALNSLGAISISAYTAANKMDSLCYMVMGAFGTAVSTFAAQNYGKKDYQRVRQGIRRSLIITVFAAFILMAFVFLLGRTFIGLFVSPNETEILTMGYQYMRLSSFFYLSLCCDFILQQGLVGVGKTTASTWVCVSEILTRIATTYLLVYRHGFFGMIFVSPACWTVSSILLIVIYRPMMIQAGVICKKRG